MSSTPRKFPIESFGPKILQLLVKGGKERIELVSTFGKLRNLSTRLYTLRAAMMREKHELYRVVARCGITILWGERGGFAPVPESEIITYKRGNQKIPKNKLTPAKMILEPRDTKFDDILKNVELPSIDLESEAPLPGPVGTATPIPHSDVSADEFLDGIFGTKD